MSKVTAIYLRVSTDKQSTDMQQYAVNRWLAENPSVVSSVRYYTDEGLSGTSAKRPAFRQLCADVEAGLVKQVVVYRLDRLSRTALTALQHILDWCRRDVDFIAIDQQALNAQAGDPFRITKLAMFAELAQIERETLVRRTKDGLAAAKARGTKLGARRKVSQEIRDAIAAAKREGKSLSQISATHNIPRSTVQYVLSRG
jgi:DNA invertase Pin-like site-specific DNA recombinase